MLIVCGLIKSMPDNEHAKIKAVMRGMHIGDA